jgi:protein required for attachment to host cells
MKPIRTWVLIADGARARVLENQGPGRGLHAVPGMTFAAEHGATHDLVDDREGRTFSSTSHSRSAIDARKDPHRVLKSDFAKALAEVLAEAEAQKAFDRLVLVAPPVMLGDLRHAVSDHVKARLAGELAQDLTKMPNADVPRHLESVMSL